MRTNWLRGRFAGHRLIVAYDPSRAAEQGERRRARISKLEDMAEKMVGKLDAQDAGKTARGRRASDRGAYSRFTRAVAEAELTRFIKADLNADRFSWSVDDDAIAEAELFDGKLTLITNAPDLTPSDAVARYKGLADIDIDQTFRLSSHKGELFCAFGRRQALQVGGGWRGWLSGSRLWPRQLSPA